MLHHLASGQIRPLFSNKPDLLRTAHLWSILFYRDPVSRTAWCKSWINAVVLWQCPALENRPSPQDSTHWPWFKIRALEQEVQWDTAGPEQDAHELWHAGKTTDESISTGIYKTPNKTEVDIKQHGPLLTYNLSGAISLKSVWVLE